MILSVNLNSILNEIIILKNFQIGEEHDILKVINSPGGCGIDAAKSVVSLGGRVIVTGFIGGKTGQIIKLLLFKSSIPFNFIEVKSESPKNQIIMDYQSKSKTFLKSDSLSIDRKELDNFSRLFKSLVRESKIVCFSGKVPNGLPQNLYSDLIRYCKSQMVATVLNGVQKRFYENLKTKPFLAILGLKELEKKAGSELKNIQDIREALEEHVNVGPYFSAVFIPPNQVLISGKGNTFLAIASKNAATELTSPIDAFVGGFAASYKHGRDLVKSVNLGLAAACAPRNELNTGLFKKKTAQELAKVVKVEKL